ncbi:MAG: hypothetical protein ACRBFS_17295 [Aureispira sp.]
MTNLFRLPVLFLSLCLLLGTSVPLTVVHAEVVYHTAPPAKKVTKKKQHRKRLRAKRSMRQKEHKKPDNIVLGLYLTFGVLLLLPIFVVAGSLLIALGFPGLLFYALGTSLIGIGNLGVILAGGFTGANQTYSTQVLFFSIWVFFGLNLTAFLTFLLLYLLIFTAAPLLLFAAIGAAVLALVFLIWGLTIAPSKQTFQKASRLKEG